MARDSWLVALHEGLQVADAHFFFADTGQQLESGRIGKSEADLFGGGRLSCLLDFGHATLNIYAKAYATS